jgi:hypothetical protein
MINLSDGGICGRHGMSLQSALGRDSVIETAYGLVVGWIATIIVTAVPLACTLVSAGFSEVGKMLM